MKTSDHVTRLPRNSSIEYKLDYNLNISIVFIRINFIYFIEREREETWCDQKKIEVKTKSKEREN